MTTLERLENWKRADKRRAVSISHDDGFGASCWEVELIHEHGSTRATECSFFIRQTESWKHSGDWVVDRKSGHVWCVSDDRPGLEATIAYALLAFDDQIWKECVLPAWRGRSIVKDSDHAD